MFIDLRWLIDSISLGTVHSDLLTSKINLVKFMVNLRKAIPILDINECIRDLQ